jgi:hypothetical protein
MTNTERYLAIAEKMKQEAGVWRHHPNPNPDPKIPRRAKGSANNLGEIWAPKERTLPQLYYVAHEAGHVAHPAHYYPSSVGPWARPALHVIEYEAEQWAHAAFDRHGLKVPDEVSMEARKCVAIYCVRDGLQFAEVEPEIQAFIAMYERTMNLIQPCSLEIRVALIDVAPLEKLAA